MDIRDVLAAPIEELEFEKCLGRRSADLIRIEFPNFPILVYGEMIT